MGTTLEPMYRLVIETTSNANDDDLFMNILLNVERRRQIIVGMKTVQKRK